MNVLSVPALLPGDWPTVQILDVGAMPEGEARYRPLLDSGLAFVTGFEPQADQLAKLRAAPGPYRWLPHILGDGRPGTFHVTRYPGCSSLLEPDPAVIDLFHRISAGRSGGNFFVVERRPVQTVRLDDVPERPRPDHVKIDVQGAALMVLEHATESLRDTLVIEVEAEFIPLYKNQPLFGDLQSFLGRQGFLFHKFVDICGRAFVPMAPPNPAAAVSQALWADAIFVRDFTRLDGFSHEQLRKAALILHEVYRSYDLALRFLTELDRRSGDDLGRRYHEALLKQGALPRHFMTVRENL